MEVSPARPIVRASYESLSFYRSAKIHTGGDGQALRISRPDGLTKSVVYCSVAIGTFDASPARVGRFHGRELFSVLQVRNLRFPDIGSSHRDDDSCPTARSNGANRPGTQGITQLYYCL